MPLADDPQAFILRMFELESREGRGAFCVSYPNGVRPPEVPLGEDELIYGIYKSKYHYSPRSLTIVGENRHSRILWSQIAHCSTKHGDGSKVSTLTLSDGSSVNIPIGEFVTGWAGRTSQLFHGMIERWGAGTAFGPKPLTVAEFFARASDDYSFAPNLEPHFSLAFLRTELESLLRVPQVVRVALLPSNAEDEELAVRSVIVVSVAELPEVLEVGKRLRASEVGAAQAASLRQLGRISDGQSAIELRWD